MLPDDFQFIATTKKIGFWKTNNCSKCGEEVGFMIVKGNVFFDECCQGRTPDGVRASTWGELAQVYNDGLNSDQSEQFKSFWQVN